MRLLGSRLLFGIAVAMGGGALFAAGIYSFVGGFPYTLYGALLMGSASSILAIVALLDTRRDRALAAVVLLLLWVSVVYPKLLNSFDWTEQEGELDSWNCEGIEAPDFILEDLEGNRVRLSSYRGNVILIVIWRSWCGRCLEEFTYLNYAHRLLSDEGLVILGINDEPKEIQEGIRGKYEILFSLLIDDKQLAAPFGQVPFFPTTFLVDQEGVIVKTHIRALYGLRDIAREVRGETWDPVTDPLPLGPSGSLHAGAPPGASGEHAH